MAATDYDFNLTRNEIVERAFRIVGALTLGETLSAEQIEQGRIALNSLVKHWQTKHIFLWSMIMKNISLVAATDNYTMGTDPGIIGIDKAWWVNGTTDEPVTILSYREYQDIPDKTSTGNPTHVALNYQPPTPTLYVYPVPSANGTLKTLAITRLQDLDTSSGNAQIPIRFLEALVFGLAEVLSFEYPVTPSEANRIERRAGQTFLEAQKSDREMGDYEFVKSAFYNQGK